MSNFTNYVVAPVFGISIAFTSAAHAAPFLNCDGRNLVVQNTLAVVNSANTTIDNIVRGDQVCMVNSGNNAEWTHVQYNRGDIGYEGFVHNAVVKEPSNSNPIDGIAFNIGKLLGRGIRVVSIIVVIAATLWGLIDFTKRLWRRMRAKDRTEPSIRVFSPPAATRVPATELGDASK